MNVTHRWIVLVLSLLSNAFVPSQGIDEVRDQEGSSYGLDVSFPIQTSRVSYNYPERANPIPGMPVQPLGNRQEAYARHLDGCHKAYMAKGTSLQCDNFEYIRIIMNQRQPQSMVNLTSTGFRKIRAPAHLKELIDDFWNDNKATMNDSVEKWGDGNTFANHWDAPTTLVSVEDKGLRGSGDRLKRHIWSAASAVLEEWTEQELQPCSLYGIRVYHEGAVMLPHVDRLPLVASAIYNVAQVSR
jgi:prolyl 4-hydroxylase